MGPTCCLIIVCLSVSLPAFAQATADTTDLPRRGWFGVALAPHESGAIVTAVVPGSSAASAGIRVGDVIRGIDGAAAKSADDVIVAVARHARGDRVVIDLLRGAVAEQRPVVLKELPRETMANVAFEYGAVTLADGTRLRTIVSVPERRAGRLPAVLLLQGGGCGSVDTPMAADVAQPGLVRAVAAHGFVTMRVEKSGVGDSRGPACTAIGYREELDGFRAALAALTRHPSVDAGRIHLVGISLGGVFAPILAAESSVRSVIVYGTLAMPPTEYPGRSERFFREFAAVDVAAAWSAVNARVLVLHGEFDELTQTADHVRIAAIINARRPGAAEYRELAGLDHGWTRHETLAQSRANAGRGAPVSVLADNVLEFMRRVESSR